MTRKHKFGGALALVLLLLLGAGLTVDLLARSALESSLGRTFGTETSVASLDLGILSGEVTLEELSVANPEGFGDARSLSLSRGRLAAGLANVPRDTVEVRELRLEGVELGLVQQGARSNLAPILASMKEAREGEGAPDETAYRIGELVLREVTARVRLGAGPAGEADTTVKIPEVRLRLPGSAEGETLREQAEEELKQMIPGRDGNG